MKIAIIGAGFTGLSAAYSLLKSGHEVTIYEKSNVPGGLATGITHKNWDWTLEKHYHHWFTNDKFVLDLAKEINHKVITKKINTSVFVQNKAYQLDSPKNILLFPKLNLLEKLRMMSIIGFLKLSPTWKPFEKVTAFNVMPKLMGTKSWNMLWLPQLINKMGEYARDISLVWIWTRIAKRTPSVAYPEGGYLNFANHLADEILKMGGKIKYNSNIQSVEDTGVVKVALLTLDKLKIEQYEKLISTQSAHAFTNLVKNLPSDYLTSLKTLKSLSATNLILRLKKPFLPNTIYWLSICDIDSPIMAIIEHTNFMESKSYNHEHLVYLGNYFKTVDKLNWSKEKLLTYYDPYLTKINPEYKKSLIDYELHIAEFAQPIIPINYSKFIPSLVTPKPNIFLANMQQVYPWDRGTNYAVELGQKVAKICVTV